MARADYHLSPANQLNAHFFADRSDSTSWPGNVNYVQQALFSDVNQFGLSDTHIFHTAVRQRSHVLLSDIDGPAAAR